MVRIPLFTDFALFVHARYFDFSRIRIFNFDLVMYLLYSSQYPHLFLRFRKRKRFNLWKKILELTVKILIGYPVSNKIRQICDICDSWLCRVA
jgi:hypothetical protein